MPSVGWAASTRGSYCSNLETLGKHAISKHQIKLVVHQSDQSSCYEIKSDVADGLETIFVQWALIVATSSATFKLFSAPQACQVLGSEAAKPFGSHFQCPKEF